MANRQHLPKFGDWTEDSPFTIVFEKASKSLKDTNMSNPKEYPEMNRNSAQIRNNRHDQPPNHNVRPKHERFSSREETEFRAFTPSPAHIQRNIRVGAPPTSESYNHQSYGGGGRSVGNPSKINILQPHDLGRPIPNLRNRRSEKVENIPPFPGSGSNVDNPSYTPIFEKVKEERNNDHHHQPLPSSPKGCCFLSWSRKGSY